MKAVYHPPGQITFPDGVAPDERRRLQTVIAMSIRRATGMRADVGVTAYGGAIDPSSPGDVDEDPVALHSNR